MSKDIWHKADITPDPYRSFVINTDKRNIYTGIITNPTEWNPMILPEFYSIADIDKAERAIKWCYLDDLLALETELERTRKSLEIAKSVLENISSFYKSLILANPVSDINWDVVAKNFAKHSDEALEQITALEQKD